MATTNPPGTIRKLDEVVVNLIAAGEVIQRPANALKELIENSLDAGAGIIQVLTKSGGMKLLQIQDDGCGIRKEDLSIVCERFTTSKLTTFEDLQVIQTYGFRGEALASISHVAQLTILTKTQGAICAYKAEYINGKLAEKETGANANPRPQAGNQGTTITVENLFYNVESRRQILKDSEEHNRILDVVHRYAIHNCKVGFSLKKHGENTNEMRTPPNSTVLDNIRVLYGVEVARELVPVSSETSAHFRMTGYVSHGNYSLKKASLILFINNRLVDSAGLKKTLDSIYARLLPKGSHSFIYLSLTLDPRSMDVNVHPTKHEVHFLHEDVILAEIGNAIDKVLQASNQSRTFYIQSLLPNATPPSNSATDSGKRTNNPLQAPSCYDSFKGKSKSDPKHLVRTDPKDRTLDTFLSPSTSMAHLSLATVPVESQKTGSDVTDSNTASATAVAVTSGTSSIQQRRVIELDSVKTLCHDVENGCHAELMTTFKNHTFVGCVDRTHALAQCDTKLYMINTVMKSKELFYQKMILNFGNIGCLQFDNPIPLQDLILVGLKEVVEVSSDVIQAMALDITTFLQSKRDMLSDYFSLVISPDGNLTGIPLLLRNYIPSMELVPFYLINLAKRVNWGEEIECFKTFCQETAHFYAIPPGNDGDNEEILLTGNTWKWTIEHVIYPEFKKSLIPQKLPAGDTTVIELVDLPSLYKVFERC